MIRLGRPDREPDASLLKSPGAFLWWYLDLLDAEGNGLVVIWSFGLPFLPGNAAAARSGTPELPAARPSVNVALYEGGAQSFYLLQEYDAGSAEPWSGSGTIAMGGSRFESRAEGGRRQVEARLDCALPGSTGRLSGVVRMEGAACVIDSPEGEGAADHLWTPLMGPGEGTAELSLGDGRIVRMRGRGYHDRNHGRVPLVRLGIGRWQWGRFPLPERELIYYLLWPNGEGDPVHLLLEIDGEGRVRSLGPVTAREGPSRRSLVGLRYPASVRLRTENGLEYRIRHRSPVDAGPFYLRFQSELQGPRGESALGWGELCVPDRVDLARHRPFVRMRVHRVGHPNSFWLPLFTGSRRGRLRRLLRQLGTRAGG